MIHDDWETAAMQVTAKLNRAREILDEILDELRQQQEKQRSSDEGEPPNAGPKS